MNKETLWTILIAALVVSMVMLIIVYVQMTKCAAVKKLIEYKGGPAEVCGWAVEACEALKEAGVIG